MKYSQVNFLDVLTAVTIRILNNKNMNKKEFKKYLKDFKAYLNKIKTDPIAKKQYLIDMGLRNSDGTKTQRCKDLENEFN